MHDGRYYFVESFCGRNGFSISQCWRVGDDLLMADTVPDRQQHLVAAPHLNLSQTIKLVLRPFLVEERWAEDKDPESRAAEARCRLSDVCCR